MARLLTALFLTFFLCSAASAATPANIAFYYGNEAPIGRLYAYDWVILQQSRVSDARIDLLQAGGTLPLSYISVDELARSHRLFPEIPDTWTLGQNTDWDSVVLDLRRRDVRDFLLTRMVKPAMDRGFQGVFLDTLDSHLLTPEGRGDPEAFAQAQAAFIEAIKEHYPDAKIVINRGFHLPEPVHDLIDGLAFESYRSGYDAAKRQYRPVPEADRNWLDGQLAHWRKAHPGLPLIAIDYADPQADFPALARQLRQDGFIPVVTDGALERLPPARPAVVPRHVLVIHDQPPEDMDQALAHHRLGIVLERLGLVPVYRSSLTPPPQEPVSDRYLGVIAWWETGIPNPAFCRWLQSVHKQGMPVVSLGMTPDDTSCQSVMNTRSFARARAPLSFSVQQPSVGNYEGSRLPGEPLVLLPVAGSEHSWLIASDGQSDNLTPIYTFDKGGVAVDPFIFEPGPDNTFYWLFDPFEFIREALKIRGIPAMDSTTESGRRILTAHIDGDGFVSRAEIPGAPLGGEVIHNQILKAYPIPHTVSVIEAETSADGLFPEVSPLAEKTASAIFREAQVEVASHSYSHPFFWQTLEGKAKNVPDPETTLYGDSLDIPGYRPELEREISGSVGYVNSLAPANKPARVFLWTGDARPGPEALARVRRLGLMNVNGGDTRPLPYHSRLAATWPDARPVGDELQIYAPLMNENVFTNLWTGPFYGFRNARDSLRLMEESGRTKPMGIYYHFYSGTKPESINALHDVYRYALSQENTPLFLSEYARRVMAQYYSVLTRDGNGDYRWRGIGSPTTLRIPANRYPDLNNSIGVAGYRDAAGQRFVHLIPGNTRLRLTPAAPEGAFLHSANAPLTDWQRQSLSRTGWRLTLSTAGHVPLELAIAGASKCKIVSGPEGRIKGRNPVRISFSQRRVRNLVMECF